MHAGTRTQTAPTPHPNTDIATDGPMDGRTGKLIKAGRVRPSRRGYKSQQRAAGPVD